MVQELSPRVEEAQVEEALPVDEKKYREFLKGKINQLKLHHEYAKLETEIVGYEAMRLQYLDVINKYRPAEKPQVAIEQGMGTPVTTGHVEVTPAE
jgi:septum formation topological specificity factor MinE